MEVPNQWNSNIYDFRFNREDLCFYQNTNVLHLRKKKKKHRQWRVLRLLAVKSRSPAKAPVNAVPVRRMGREKDQTWRIITHLSSLSLLWKDRNKLTNPQPDFDSAPHTSLFRGGNIMTAYLKERPAVIHAKLELRSHSVCHCFQNAFQIWWEDEERNELKSIIKYHHISTFPTASLTSQMETLSCIVTDLAPGVC